MPCSLRHPPGCGEETIGPMERSGICEPQEATDGIRLPHPEEGRPGVVQFERAWRERSEAGSRSSRSLENTVLIVSGAESEEVMVIS